MHSCQSDAWSFWDSLARWNGVSSRTARMRGCCTRTQQCDASRERGYHALVRPVMAGCPRSVANSADGERTLVYRAACSIRFDIMLRKKELCAHPDLRVRFARRGRRASVWKEGGFQTLPIRCRFRSTGCRKSSPVSKTSRGLTPSAAHPYNLHNMTWKTPVQQ